MPQQEYDINQPFVLSGPGDFNAAAVQLFYHQYKNNPVYRKYVDFLHIDVSSITHYTEIPFLPIEFFKSQRIMTGEFKPEIVFQSSGTTGLQTSRHFVKDLALYRKSFLKTFELFYGKPKNSVILALLPSYLERQGSSLVYMAGHLIKMSGQTESGFYLKNLEKLARLLTRLKKEKKKTILIGVTYALLDLAEQYPVNFPELTLIETGGMKGRRKEIVREELHQRLKSAFHLDKICSEYGMTELLSQAYSKGDGIFKTPPWMKILIRDPIDPPALLPLGKTGGINIIDLANVHSCVFIATQDLGKQTVGGGFEVLGRFDSSDVRGCNLMIS